MATLGTINRRDGRKIVRDIEDNLKRVEKVAQNPEAGLERVAPSVTKAREAVGKLAEDWDKAYGVPNDNPSEVKEVREKKP